jgi:hypothetical protein
MGSLDIPEVLIALSMVAMFAWFVYNHRHPGTGARK